MQIPPSWLRGSEGRGIRDGRIGEEKGEGWAKGGKGRNRNGSDQVQEEIEAAVIL